MNTLKTDKINLRKTFYQDILFHPDQSPKKPNEINLINTPHSTWFQPALGKHALGIPTVLQIDPFNQTSYLQPDLNEECLWYTTQRDFLYRRLHFTYNKTLETLRSIDDTKQIRTWVKNHSYQPSVGRIVLAAPGSGKSSWIANHPDWIDADEIMKDLNIHDQGWHSVQHLSLIHISEPTRPY